MLSENNNNNNKTTTTTATANRKQQQQQHQLRQKILQNNNLKYKRSNNTENISNLFHFNKMHSEFYFSCCNTKS